MENNVEVKVKKKKGKKVLLIILLIILLIVASFFIKSLVRKYQNKRFINNLNTIQQEEVMNVIVEINPSIALVVKNDTIIDSYCLNEDCENLLTKMNATLKSTINNNKFDKTVNILYNMAKKYGYNTENGINISSSSSKVASLVKDIDNATFEYITIEKEKEILKDNKNESIDNSKQDYNDKLLKKLKKDKDYDKTYTCQIDNGEVKCYMKDFMEDMPKNISENELASAVASITIEYANFKNLLNKFNFSYSFTTIDGEPDKNITLGDGKIYDYGDSATGPIMDCNNNVLDKITVKYALMPRDNNDNQYVYIPFTKVNLITKTYEKKDVIIIDKPDCTFK